MIPWQRIDSAALPALPSQRTGAKPAELTLWKRNGGELVIRVGHTELMSSRQHHSEDELGRLSCAHLARGQEARVLIGGLGMGFTLRAVLNAVGPKAIVEVAELVPGVVAWNRGILGELANHPLNDKRVRLFEGDVFERITRGANYDAILLDVDNGPAALTTADNTQLYNHRGLELAREALRPGGVLGVWSAADDPRFSKRFKSAGFDVLRHHVRARPEAGAIHVLSIGTKVIPGRDLRPEAASPMRRREEYGGPGGRSDERDERRPRGFPGGGFPSGGGRGRPRRERGAVAGRYGSAGGFGDRRGGFGGERGAAGGGRSPGSGRPASNPGGPGGRPSSKAGAGGANRPSSSPAPRSGAGSGARASSGGASARPSGASANSGGRRGR